MKIQEGEANVFVSEGKPTRAQQVFYNPIMKLQRDIDVAVLNALSFKELRVADVLAGTGIRSIRFMLEVPKVKKVSINDVNPRAIKFIKKNLKANKLKAEVSQKDGSEFLLQSLGFNYVDIDPFGPPSSFLDAACKRLVTPGVMGVTATDTAALTGSSVAACIRKYWARPLKNEFMQETGMRILVRKIQLIGSQYDKALTPIYCHRSAHYMRVYMKSERGKKNVKESLRHGYIHYCFRCCNRKTMHDNKPGKCCKAPMSVAGPLYIGKLWDSKLAKKVAKSGIVITKVIAEESKIDSVGYYSIHKIAKKNKLTLIKTEQLIEKLRKKGFKVAETHFDKVSIRTNATIKELKKMF